MKELAESIRTQGVLSPLLVRPLTEKGFEIVAGARRYRAAQMAEADRPRPHRQSDRCRSVGGAVDREPAAPRRSSDGGGAGLPRLLDLDEPKYSIEQIAAKTGKTPAYVTTLCG